MYFHADGQVQTVTLFASYTFLCNCFGCNKHCRTLLPVKLTRKLANQMECKWAMTAWGFSLLAHLCKSIPFLQTVVPVEYKTQIQIPVLGSLCPMHKKSWAPCHKGLISRWQTNIKICKLVLSDNSNLQNFLPSKMPGLGGHLHVWEVVG